MITPLHVRSNYSLLYGANHVQELVRAAKKMGYRSLALTDINNLYGVHVFCESCRREGIRPILGAEVQDRDNRAVVLARTGKGFSNITELLTRHLLDQDGDLPRLLGRYSEDVFILSDSLCLLSTLKGRVPELYAMVTGMSEAVPALARQLDLPLAASGEVCFVSSADREVHRLLRAIYRKTVLSRLPENDCVAARAYLASPQELAARFALWPEAVRNTGRIGAACRFREIYRGLVFPHYPLPDGQCQAETLRNRALVGARRRYHKLTPAIFDRLEYELDIIISKGFVSYFLLVADITALASRICGRGSAAASLVAYSLGITNVDPIRHNLYFDRFLNPERPDPPDIDIDFAWDERDAVVEKVRERYGIEHCAFVCNHVRFKRRSALREVARCYGVPAAEIKNVSTYLSRLKRLGRPGVIPTPAPGYLDEPWPVIIRLARRLVGFPRCLSVHVGGLVITPQPVYSYVPVETAPKGVPVITWEKDGTEAAGLVKIDLLCNRSLGVIRDALANLRENGIDIEREKWNTIDDLKTQRLLARGDTIGVFYVESPAMRQLQKKTGRGDFEHLVIHSSIIRPAANRYINEYVERLNGKPYRPLHPVLSELLEETYGIMCYQEDVSRTARALAGFSAGEADELRRILSKKSNSSSLAGFRQRFFDGALRRRVGRDVITTVWEMIESFSGYSFCKPHSASYAQVSFQSAYLKAHHPAEFLAAVLTNGGGYYSSAAYISEAHRLGVRVEPPDVNRSRYRYVARDGQIVVGLMAVAGLKQATGKLIEQKRAQGGNFSNLEDFLKRVLLQQTEIEALVDVGALDSISPGQNRSSQLWTALVYDYSSGGCSPSEKTLFPEDNHIDHRVFDMSRSATESKRGWSRLERLKREYFRLGFLCGQHPLTLIRSERRGGDQFCGRRLVKAATLDYFRGRRVTVLGWPVTRKTISTGRGDPMEFVSFEDETAIFETVLFPAVYRQFSHLVDEVPRGMLIIGRVQNDRGAIYVNVEQLTRLQPQESCSLSWLTTLPNTRKSSRKVTSMGV